MKLVVLAVLISLGCGSKREAADQEEAAGSARPSVSDPLGFCERARRMILRRRKCFEEDVSLKMALDGIADQVAHAPEDPGPRRRIAASCAITLDGMMRVEQPKMCPLDVTDEERAELAAFLAAWYGERTPAPTTGDEGIDAVLVKLAAQRDAACACKALDCARKAAEGLDNALPAGAPEPATTAVAKMLDEVARCRQRIAYGPPAP